MRGRDTRWMHCAWARLYGASASELDAETHDELIRIVDGAECVVVGIAADRAVDVVVVRLHRERAVRLPADGWLHQQAAAHVIEHGKVGAPDQVLERLLH